MALRPRAEELATSEFKFATGELFGKHYGWIEWTTSRIC